MDNHSKELQQIIDEMIKEKNLTARRLLLIEWVICILSVLLVVIPSSFVSFLPIEEWQKVVIIFLVLIPALAGFAFALRIEQVAGYYECKHCGHKYVPTYKAVVMAAHVGRTRRMMCPECKRKSWQKKVISKD